MRDKAHNPSGRIVRGRVACLLLVLCIPLSTLLGAGNAYAGAPLTLAIGGVTTVATAPATAPVGTVAAQALGAPPNPVTSPTAAAPGVTATPLAKAPMSNAAGVGGGGPALAKATTQSAAATITTLGKAVTPSAGHVLAVVSNAATQALAPTVQSVGRIVTPSSGLIHLATSSSEPSAGALATVLKAAVGSVTGIATPASRTGASLGSAPPAALRGAIGALAHGLPAAATPAAAGTTAGTDRLATPMPGLTAVALAGASGCALFRLQGLLGERCRAGHPPGPSFPGRSPGSLLGAAGSALATSTVGAGSGGSDTRAGPGSHGVPGAVPIPAPSGVSGSAAAAGFAVSICLTIAALLLLAAPRAMRRLRLPREPWLDARFVLIPERPG